MISCHLSRHSNVIYHFDLSNMIVKDNETDVRVRVLPCDRARVLVKFVDHEYLRYCRTGK